MNECMIRVMLANEQQLIRQGIQILLDTGPDMELVGKAANGLEALEIVDGRRPDVVLIDVWMPVMDGVPALWFNGICQITVQPVSNIVRHSNGCSSG